MPIGPSNPRPPFNVVRCSYAELGVADLARSREFYAAGLGLLEREETGGSLYLHGIEERQHHSVVLTEAAEPICRALGYQVGSEDDLDRAEAFFRERGLTAEWAARHGQGRTLRVRDPFGVPLEFYFAMDQGERTLQQYGRYTGAHVMRLDHFNLFAADIQGTYDFYARELGFRLTEYTETEEEPARLWAVWLHRKGNVHDLALTNGRGPRLHHIGVWVPAITNIIHLCDVFATTGRLAALERGPGRHGIANAFFLYVRDPDGHRVELFTSDYQTVDPDFRPIAWKLRDAQRQTLWGHPAPRSWFEEGTPFEGVEPREPAVAAQPIVAP
jgi:catechol 2,3-dioxygenase